MGLRSADILTSKKAPAERHIQLYKDLHDMFLQRDFINLQDFLIYVQETNARIAELENKLNVELNKIATDLATHVHQVATAGGPTNQVGATTATVSKYTPALSPTKPLAAKKTNVTTRNNTLQAIGPASTPLGDPTGLV